MGVFHLWCAGLHRIGTDSRFFVLEAHNWQQHFIAIGVSLAVSVPLSIYANVTENMHLIVLSSVSGVLISALVCAFSGLLKKPYEILNFTFACPMI